MASGEHDVIFCSIFSVNGTAESKHRQDALISAVAAREGFEGRWTIDLSKNRHECETRPFCILVGSDALFLAQCRFRDLGVFRQIAAAITILYTRLRGIGDK